MKVTCVVAERRHEVVVVQGSLREPGEHELVVQTLYSCISPGTELRCLAGKEANAGKFPKITGYSQVGRVIKSAGAIRAGDLVFLNGTSVVPDGITSAWGGHLSRCIALPEQVVKLPPAVDLKMASALSMVSVAMHGVCRAAPLPGDRVLIVGQGLIGQFAAVLLKLAGCRVAVCDPLSYRLDVAGKLGIEFRYVAAENWQHLLRRDFPDGVDMLVDATGSAKVIAANLPLLRDKSWSNGYEPSPKLVLLASYPDEVCLDYRQTLFNKETEIITCRTYLPHERERVLRLLAFHTLDILPVLSDTLPARQAPEAFRRLRDEPNQWMTMVLDWSAES